MRGMMLLSLMLGCGLIAALGSGCAFAEGLEIKGLKPGASLEEVPNIRSYRCLPMEAANWQLGDVHCIGGRDQTIAGVSSSLVFLFFINNTLQRASFSFSPASFDQVAQALEAKFGSPKITTEALVTRVGVRYENSSHEWTDGAVTIEARRYAGDITRGEISISLNSYYGEIAKRRKQKAADSSKNDL